MASIIINNIEKNFDKIFYFSQLGSDEHGNGTENDPFFTPTAVFKKGLLQANSSAKNICFFIKEGYYSGFDIWFDTDKKTITDNIVISIYGEKPTKTIIDCSKLIKLTQKSNGNNRINIYNLKIKWNNIEENFNGIIRTEQNITIPTTNIQFYNIYFTVGNVKNNTRWYFYSGSGQRGQVTFENCMLLCEDFYTEDSFNVDASYTNNIIFTNNIIQEKLNLINMNPNISSFKYNFFIKTLKQDYWTFPLNKQIAHKGSETILNPDNGISHIGICGGQNAWYYDTYWYKFLNDDNDYIPLSQVKQKYGLKSTQIDKTLEDQIKYIEKLIDDKNNKIKLLTFDILKTYDFISLFNFPKIFYSVIDDTFLGKYDINNIHTIEIKIDTPYYYNSKQELKVFKNGVLQDKDTQYQIENNSSIIIFNVNIGDEIQIYVGWKNYDCNIHIEYDDNNRIKQVCSDLNLTSSFKYEDDILVEQQILNGDNIIKIKNYVYDKTNNITNLILKNNI